MNYLSNFLKKKPNSDAIVNANRMFETGEKLTDANIDNLIIKYRIPDKNKASFEKDLKTEYDRLSQIKENDRQMRQKELDGVAKENALRELLDRNNITDKGIKFVYTIKGGMNKRRKTANKRRKSNKTRRQRKKIK